MTANTLTVTYEDLRREVAREMGWDRTVSRWSDDRVDDLKDILKAGYRQFLNADVLPGENKTHGWSFLYPLGSLTLEDWTVTGSQVQTAYTGPAADNTYLVTWTLTPVNASQRWPLGLVGSTVSATHWTGDEYSVMITMRTSDTVISGRTDTSYASGPATTFAISLLEYELPDDFGGMYSDGFTFRRDEQWHLPDITIVGEAEIRREDRSNNGEIYPRLASLVPVAPFVAGGSKEQSTRWLVRFYPAKEQVYHVEYRYHSIPPALDETTNIYHYGGMEHSETIIASCIDKAYQKIHASYEKHEQYMARLRQSVLRDRRFHTETRHGKGAYSVGDQTTREVLRDFRGNTPTSNITLGF